MLNHEEGSPYVPFVFDDEMRSILVRVLGHAEMRLGQVFDASIEGVIYSGERFVGIEIKGGDAVARTHGGLSVRRFPSDDAYVIYGFDPSRPGENGSAVGCGRWEDACKLLAGRVVSFYRSEARMGSCAWLWHALPPSGVEFRRASDPRVAQYFPDVPEECSEQVKRDAQKALGYTGWYRSRSHLDRWFYTAGPYTYLAWGLDMEAEQFIDALVTHPPVEFIDALGIRIADQERLVREMESRRR